MKRSSIHSSSVHPLRRRALRFESLELRQVLSAAPTTSGFDKVEAPEDSADQVVSLFDAFEDDEDSDAELTYSIRENNNPALFANLTIDSSAGQLIIDSADNAYGNADLVIRATDTEGNYVETTLEVKITSVNDAPVISNFVVFRYGSALYISGDVTDVDDDPTGWTVDLGGNISETAVVNPSGSFAIMVTAPWNGTIFVTAQTEDPHGEESDLVGDYSS